MDDPLHRLRGDARQMGAGKRLVHGAHGVDGGSRRGEGEVGAEEELVGHAILLRELDAEEVDREEVLANG